MPSSIQKNKQAWDDLGALDPLYAVISDPSCQHGKWDVDRFFASGDADIGRLMSEAEGLGLPTHRRVALDFGCGVGRLTRALSRYFPVCHGIDISDPMIEQARQLNEHIPQCQFRVNAADNLAIFDDGQFDLVYTNIVLQHIPDREIIRSYIREFVRILAEGGLLAFQLPSRIGWKGRLQPRARAYSLLRGLGAGPEFLYEKMQLHPMRMNFIPEADVVGLIASQGARVLQVTEADKSVGGGMQARRYFVTR
jgi:SAM-dependent methyltransferase